MDHDKAIRSLERQLAKAKHAQARDTYLWLVQHEGDVGKRGVSVRRILRNAPATAFLEHLKAMSLVLGFLQPRNARNGLERLRELAEAGEMHSILFLSCRLALHEMRGASAWAKPEDKKIACRWLAPLVRERNREACALATRLAALPTADEVMCQQFPMAFLDNLVRSRNQAQKQLERIHRSRKQGMHALGNLDGQ